MQPAPRRRPDRLRARRVDGGDLLRLEGVQHGVRDRGVVGLMPAAERDPRRAEAAQVDLEAVPVDRDDARLCDLRERRTDSSRTSPSRGAFLPSIRLIITLGAL